MKKINVLLLTLVLTFITSSLFAHALWIETAATGTIGKEQTVRIYYGEFVENERDSVAKWFSDIKDFGLWLVGPDQKRVQLKTRAGINYYEATFTPTQNGSYTLAVSHYAKELGETSRYHFLASAEVSVGKAGNVSASAVNILQFQKQGAAGLAQVSKPLQVKLFTNGTPAAAKKVHVFSPNGWSKEVTTDASGILSFVPPVAGRYILEISDQDKTAGEQGGKKFEDTWNTASYSVEVK